MASLQKWYDYLCETKARVISPKLQYRAVLKKGHSRNTNPFLSEERGRGGWHDQVPQSIDSLRKFYCNRLKAEDF